MMTPKMMAMAAWVFQVMIKISPIDKSIEHEHVKETYAQAEQRYHEIADAITEVTLDEDEPSLEWHDYDKKKTLALVIATAHRESGNFAREVDFGIGIEGVRDHGNSWCMMQINLPPGRRHINLDGRKYKYDPNGWSGRDLVEDRKRCFKVGLHVLRAHWFQCWKNQYTHRLASYLSGSCDSNVSKEESTVRVNLASWISRMKFDSNETALLEE